MSCVLSLLLRAPLLEAPPRRRPRSRWRSAAAARAASRTCWCSRFSTSSASARRSSPAPRSARWSARPMRLGLPALRIRAMFEETLSNRFDLARQLFAARSDPVQKLLRLVPLRTSLLSPETLLGAARTRARQAHLRRARHSPEGRRDRSRHARSSGVRGRPAAARGGGEHRHPPAVRPRQRRRPHAGRRRPRQSAAVRPPRRHRRHHHRHRRQRRLQGSAITAGIRPRSTC